VEKPYKGLQDEKPWVGLPGDGWGFQTQSSENGEIRLMSK